VNTRIDQRMKHDIHLECLMFYGLINPCIHLIESHQLYITWWFTISKVNLILKGRALQHVQWMGASF